MNTKITVVIGNITEQKVDAIVNAANTNLVLGSGVAGAVRNKRGLSIQEECKNKSPIKLGESIETNAGNLPAKYVIHAASMSWNSKPNEKTVKDCIVNSLKIAEKFNCESIAFPAIGTGIGEMSKENCARIMKEILTNYNPIKIKEIRIVLFDNLTYDLFKKLF